MVSNYTPIDDLVDKNKTQGSSANPEKPIFVDSIDNMGTIEMHETKEYRSQQYNNWGVQDRQEKIKLPKELLREGVVARDSSSFISQSRVDLPISDDVVYKGLHSKLGQSIRWLAEYCVFILKKSHLALKKVHGKIIRITTK